MDLKRLEISRLFNRFAFGPRPGEFAEALRVGPAKFKTSLLNPPAIDAGEQTEPILVDLGQRPAPKSLEAAEFSKLLRAQKQELTLWWLDQMVLTQKPLQERMVWFWHGHFATRCG